MEERAWLEEWNHGREAEKGEEIAEKEREEV